MSDQKPLPSEGGEEHRMYGPPGCGKTTRLAAEVKRSAQARGYDKVIVTSFTKTAAEELAGRGLPIPKSQLGTLHALCFRALDNPPLAQSQIDDWNTYAPHFRLSGGSGNATGLDEAAWDQAFASDSPGDPYLAQCDVLRAQQIPQEAWPTGARSFHGKWEDWKQGAGLLDFSDLLEIALQDVARAPGNPEVMFVDEAQDMTALELAVVRQWGAHMDRYVVTGDDDQSIFSFRGSRVSDFIGYQVPPERKQVLSRSYRVPAAVHATAESWVHQLSMREPKEYFPRTVSDDSDEIAPGRCRLLIEGSWRMPEPIVADAERQMELGRSVAFLTTCSYMLDPLKHRLRALGLPFHNEHRRKRSDWNPLARGRENSTSSIDRLLAYLSILPEDQGGRGRTYWTHDELSKWINPLATKGLLAHGAKSKIEKGIGRHGQVDLIDLAEWFEPDALGDALDGNLEWFEKNLVTSKRKAMEYPVRVVHRGGTVALSERPLLTIGSIHSVKGATFDCVYLFPDTSSAGMNEWMSPPGERRDSVIRQMYVGLTRAREELVLCSPTSSMHVDMRQHVMKGAVLGI